MGSKEIFPRLSKIKLRLYTIWYFDTDLNSNFPPKLIWLFPNVSHPLCTMQDAHSCLITTVIEYLRKGFFSEIPIRNHKNFDPNVSCISNVFIRNWDKLAMVFWTFWKFRRTGHWYWSFTPKPPGVSSGLDISI